MNKLSKKAVITIDGGSGTGKTTVSKALSKKIGVIYVDTGAMYRACALYFLENGIEITDENIESNLSKIDVDLKIDENGENHVFLNNRDVTGKIRTDEVSMAASTVSKNLKLRALLVEKQRKIAGDSSVVVEGRDAATVIFPNADVKLFFVTEIDIRSKRRYNDLVKKDKNIKLENVKDNLVKRDFQDSNRKNSPLEKATDAYVIDTTNNTVEETTKQILDIIDERIGLI